MRRSITGQSRLLLRFGRLVSEATAPEDMLRLLVDATVDPDGVGAAAAASLRVDPDQSMRVATAVGLPPALAGFSEEFETVGAELGERLRAVWGGNARAVVTLPLVAGRDVFGALVMFSEPNQPFARAQTDLAEGLADLVAVALDRAARHGALEKSLTEVRASREALERSERLRALGEMATGVSHDIKNLLNPIKLQIQLLRRRILTKAAETGDTLDAMEQSVRAATDLVERLKGFGQQGPASAAEAVNLEAALKTAVALCEPRLRGTDDRFQIVSEPGDTSPVWTQGSELVTALVNLVVNALEAMTDGGRVTIRTGAEGNGAWIEVEDDGPGMPPEVKARVFEPFFTTKAQGTGLGLATVYAFVKRHGGSVTIDSEQGRGTRIRLWFPSAMAQAAG